MDIIFVNLDNTLIKTKSGKKFPLHSKDWIFIPETINALKYYLNRRNNKVVIITNQLGIEQGFINETVFVQKIEDICNKLEKVLALKKNTISYRYCKKDNTFDTIPSPGMVFEFLMEEELTLYNSVMLGEADKDKTFSINAGIQTYHSIADIVNTDWL